MQVVLMRNYMQKGGGGEIKHKRVDSGIVLSTAKSLTSKFQGINV